MRSCDGMHAAWSMVFHAAITALLELEVKHGFRVDAADDTELNA